MVQLRGRFVIVDRRDNSQRHLDCSRAERKKNKLDMARAKEVGEWASGRE